jgi:two-component sensor histidine kinase
LISNCLKHAFPGGRKGKIIVALQPVGKNTLELIVEDDGVGLSKAVDIHNTETLGLQLIAILAEEQLHGKVTIKRRRGTTFRITLKVKGSNLPSSHE